MEFYQKKINHPSIVKVLGESEDANWEKLNDDGSVKTQKVFYIVLEFIENGDLYDFVQF